MSANRLPGPRPRFSLISLFTNNGGRQSKRSKTKTKHKSADATQTASVSGTSEREVVTVPPLARVRVCSDGEERMECPLCCEELPVSLFPRLISCPHQSCEACMQKYLKIEIAESRVDITCPECTERIHPADIQKLLCSDSHMTKYEEFMVRRVLVTDPDARWCPAPDCGYAVIARGCAGCPMLVCERPGCNTNFCYHCKQTWHANKTCDVARAERLPILRMSFTDNISHTVEEYKPCPRCESMIIKMDDGSCNHMTCSICGAQFCWLCLQEASDLHYLSPSGCTFWGKKPWSRKKKILWQIGTLIGAPVGIALIAGISIPILVIGLPIWAGRKLFQRFKTSNKHKRNTVVTLGTVAAFLASPVVAAIAIAIGVPIMLAYVYGVVPISLCRGGTCGVKSDNGTFTFDFGKGQDDGGNGEPGTFLVTNPSIGPSIGEASLTAGYPLSASAIQMDKIGLTDDQSDRQSASIRNLTGNSLAGSIYDQGSTNPKMEVHADVTQPVQSERKNSLDSTTLSQADTRSLDPDTRSLRSDNRSHVSFNDNASMKALAGSICAPRDKDGQSVVIHIGESADVRSKRVRGEHGSPVSNRSVSFATRDEVSANRRSSSGKRKKRSSNSSKKLLDFDPQTHATLSVTSESVPINKRCTEYKSHKEKDKPPTAGDTADQPVTDTFILCNIIEDKRLDTRSNQAVSVCESRISL